MSFVAKCLPAVLGFVCLSLEGCGCNTDAAMSCSATFSTAFSNAQVGDNVVSQVCSVANTYVQCIKDSGCCSDSEIKASMD